MYVDWGTVVENVPEDGYQWKAMHLVSDYTFQSSPAILFQPWKHPVATDSYNIAYQPDTLGGITAPTELKNVTNTNPFGDLKWSRMDLSLLGDATNGEVHARYLNPTDGLIVEKNYIGPILTESAWKNFIFGVTVTNVKADNTIDTTMYYDDIYIDDSWARVEFGNNAVYASCTHLEMQIPTSWPTGESAKDITTTENFGSLDPNDDIYLFVTNNSGETSDGFLVNTTNGPQNAVSTKMVSTNIK